MMNLSLNEIKLIAKNRDIKDYEKTIFSEPKTKISPSKRRIKDIKEKLKNQDIHFLNQK